MKEQLITQRTAVLAKGKGYMQNPYKTKDAYVARFTDGTDIYLNSSLYSPDNNVAVAPTQALLQKWLREIHSIDVIVDRAGAISRKREGFLCGITTLHKYIASWNLEGLHKVYEDALEVGLYAGLRLIEEPLLRHKAVAKEGSDCKHTFKSKELGYIAHAAWAEKQFKKGFDQTQCEDCGLWLYPEEV